MPPSFFFFFLISHPVTVSVLRGLLCPCRASEARTRHSATVWEGLGVGGHIVCKEGEGDTESLREEPACLEIYIQVAMHGTSGDTDREGPEGTV